MVKVEDRLNEILTSDSIDIHQWLAAVDDKTISDNYAPIKQAWEFASKVYGEKKTIAGDSILHHAICVASILIKINLDSESICAALMHAVLDDENVTSEQLSELFGSGLAQLVEGLNKAEEVTSLRSNVTESEIVSQSEKLRRMVFATANDVRVVLIKVAEQLQVMRVLEKIEPEQRIEIAKETRDIYAPIANLLGVWQIKWELEDLAFRHLENKSYKKIAKSLAERRVDRESYIEKVTDIVKKELDSAGIRADVKGRPKHIYSIWKKMQKKHKSFDELFDVRAIRVMVDTVAQCYAVLGAVHGLWRHIPKEFDDYIATPKGNNYQSLHTAVIGPEGKNLEIQIRTYEMHENSELGVAAHWRYKEGSSFNAGFQQKVNLLRQYIESGQDEDGSSDSVNEAIDDVFDDRVYVITPKGKVFDLCKDATPIDFAYMVHTEIGHKCIGAKVNGKIVPLTYNLQSGDTVEILTKSNASPSRDWLVSSLGFVKSSKTKSKIRAWFKHQNLDENITSGKALYEREVHRLGMDGFDIQKLLDKSQCQTPEEYFAALGRGEISNEQLLTRLQENLKLSSTDTHEEYANIVRKPKGRDSGDVEIYGVGNLMTYMANCCKPVPEEPIVGFISKNRGVGVHRQDCPNIQNLSEDDERLIEISWNTHTKGNYSASLKIEAYDRPGLFNEISHIFSLEKVNITAINTNTTSDKMVLMSFSVQITDVAKLSRVINKIASVPSVIDVVRMG
ncbi:MAG: bifunctional (p)ppGpp synthetase/guanosine-3',5'-bis(diphosphate) 3'-pyrophosphohydrolase [Gammaproteobacteria bacterium]|nr:MAG: bifunctional (p)ppGpp synthetase/guanosine-3',5'-bis(diphosphate) 3'-pyrophosphohydrolase [Gammaproteobacteria bacterium]